MPMPDRRAIVRQDASYLLTGGTGGLGRSVTRWLARHGAKYIILLSRSGLSQKSAQDLVEELSRTGVKVAVYKCDIGDENQSRDVINQCASDMPPIRGVIHGAMVLQVCNHDAKPDFLLQKLTNIDRTNFSKTLHSRAGTQSSGREYKAHGTSITTCPRWNWTFSYS